VVNRRIQDYANKLKQGGLMKARLLLYIGMILLVGPALSGCWLLAGGALGAYGGYKAKEEGYTLRNPVTKEKPDKPERVE
jgi:hypothetical protein